ncbi:hypothetical protein [Acrocarpospora phusangensis]|uniref:hypothetical protein n=1 Tax=Acrocarpospora phusangensis TaxID=1070424 RepID=UPI00194FD1EC|nr:hypothetical protein [Acrocarpospora phusangensis]
MAILLVAVVTLVRLTGGSTGKPAAGSPSPAAAESPPPAAAESPSPAVRVAGVRDLWPQALIDLPDTVPDLHMLNTLDATRVLLHDETSTLIKVYDTATGRLSDFTSLPELAADSSTLCHTWVGGDQVVFDVLVDEFQRHRLWTVPLSGGQPVEVPFDDPEAIFDSAEIATGHLVRSDRGAVYRLPLPGGGTPQPVPGSEGLTPVGWPWASDLPAYPGILDEYVALGSDYDLFSISAGEEATDLTIATASAVPETASPTPAPIPSATKVVNLETGEVRPVTPAPGVQGLRCGPDLCYGENQQNRMVTTGLDGRDLVELPLTPIFTGNEPPGSRFIAVAALPPGEATSSVPVRWTRLLAPSTDLYVYDTQTRTLAVAHQSGEGVGTVICFPGTSGWRTGDLVHWSTDPDDLTFREGVNLKAV